jgi:predicted outer membrane protein
MNTKIVGSLMAACLIGTASAACGAEVSVWHSDKQFVRAFSKISLEIERIGQLAQTQSQDAEVKELGQKLVQAYTQAGQRVAASAQTVGIVQKPRISRSAAREVNKLADLSGVAFNQAVLRQLHECVESGVHELDLETRNSGNVALRHVAALVESDMEPVVWRTAELSAQLNSHP